MMMAIEGFVFYALIFIIEKLKTISSLTQFLTRETHI